QVGDDGRAALDGRAGDDAVPGMGRYAYSIWHGRIPAPRRTHTGDTPFHAANLPRGAMSPQARAGLLAGRRSNARFTPGGLAVDCGGADLVRRFQNALSRQAS